MGFRSLGAILIDPEPLLRTGAEGDADKALFSHDEKAIFTILFVYFPYCHKDDGSPASVPKQTPQHFTTNMTT